MERPKGAGEAGGYSSPMDLSAQEAVWRTGIEPGVKESPRHTCARQMTNGQARAQP